MDQLNLEQKIEMCIFNSQPLSISNSGEENTKAKADNHHTLTEDPHPLEPFLKWAGGKRWLIRKSKDLFPNTIKGIFYEPFLGGASAFASIMPLRSKLSDKNRELINVYCQIKCHWKDIISGLKEMQSRHSR